MSPRRISQLAVLLAAVGVTAWALLSADGPAREQSGAGAASAGAELARPVRVGTIALPEISESSGLVASRRAPGLYWTINDSGGPARLYAIDSTGKSLGTATLTGAANRDWEDLAADEQGKLYVGDFGDNARRRRTLSIYILPEPDPRKSGTVRVEKTCVFAYPQGHGPFDCEAMFVRAGWAYLITKEDLSARLYRVGLDGPEGRTAEAEYLGTVPEASWVTGADISPDGRRVAVISYLKVYVYDLPEPLEKLAAKPLASTSGPAQAEGLIRVRPRICRAAMGQAEGICWVLQPAGGDLLITNEQRDIFRVRAALPRTASAPNR